MKVRVKLYGTLRGRFPDYDHAEGMEVEMPDRSTARDLIALLEIPESQAPVAAVKGRILKADDEMADGFQVHLFQPIHGG